MLKSEDIMITDCFDITKIKAPVLKRHTDQEGYSHPVVCLKEDIYYLFYTVTQKTEDGNVHKKIGVSTSKELLRYTKPRILFEEKEEIEFCHLGSVVLFQGIYYLCFEGRTLQTGEYAIYISKSTDLICFSEPFALSISRTAKGECFPFMVVDKEKSDRIWCLYNDVGVTRSWSNDLDTWHNVGTSSIKFSGLCIVPCIDGYTVFANQKEGIGVFTIDSIEQFLLHPCEDGPKVLTLDFPYMDWAQGGIRCGSVVWEERLGLYILFYWGVEKGNDAIASSLALAVSKDLSHWTSFVKDQATYSDNGVVYDGDYYKPLPFSEYIHKEVPQGPIFDIRAYGAVADGSTLCTEAFQAAAMAARDAGGGTILVTGGHYCVGTIELYDNTTLFIDMDSALCASKDLSRYQDALLACVNRKNVTIRGGGKIVGNGEYFAYLPLKKPLLHPIPYTKLPSQLYDPMGYPVDTIRYAYRSRIRYAEDKYGEGLPAIQRPMYTVWIRGCEHVHIENIIIEDSLDWTLDIDYSMDVSIQDVVINGNRHVANTDGIDIMSSSHVTVKHCFISCADDGICIKAPMKQGHDGINVSDEEVPMGPTRDIHISDCTVLSVMNAFKIGTETYFDIEDVTLENCRFLMPDIYPGSVSGISIESADGSHIRNIRVRDVEMDQVCCPIFICLNMRNKFGFMDDADRKERYYGGSIQNVEITNIKAWNVEMPSILTGFCTGETLGNVERKIENITIRQYQAVYRDNTEILDVKTPVYENLFDYPECNAFGDVPAYGFYVRHANQVLIEECEILARSGNTRACIVME